MKFSKLFTLVFILSAIGTFTFFSLSSYALKKAIEEDPEVIGRVQDKYNIQWSGVSLSKNLSKESVEKEWSFSEPFREIITKSVGADVEIAPSSDGKVTVHAVGHLPQGMENEDALLKVEIKRGKLTIKQGEDVKLKKLFVRVPKDIESLVVNNVSGDVEVRDISTAKFTNNSVSGDLHIDGLVSKELKSNSVSGDIELKNISPQEMSIVSVSGDIKIHFDSNKKVDLDFKFRTLSGDIKNAHPSVESAPLVSVTTTSGDIEID